MIMTIKMILFNFNFFIYIYIYEKVKWLIHSSVFKEGVFETMND